MKICKNDNGYFILDNHNQVVNLSYKGKVQRTFPTIAHLGLCFWVSNERNNIVDENSFDVLIDDINSFKAVKYAILEHLVEKGLQ